MSILQNVRAVVVLVCTAAPVLVYARTAEIMRFIPDASNSWVFPAECRDPAAPSPIDLRGLNEPVAGARGPLRRAPDGSHLLYADGRRFNAWLVHMPHGLNYERSQDTWSYADYQRNARFLARLGVNAGIIGCSDPAAGMADPLAINPVVLTSLHCSVAAARAAGIYTQLRIVWFHGITGAALGIDGHEKQDLQCLVLFHPRVQQAWKAWAKALLTAVNPHTGMALKDDPALFSVEIANEDSLLFYVTDRIQGGARAELERQFHTWAVQKYGAVSNVYAAWQHTKDPDDNPEGGRLAVVKIWFLTRAGRGHVNEQRVRDQLQFLVETSRAWNREAARFLKHDVGARHILVAGSNFVPADRVTMDDALRLLTWRDMDIIENNHYFTDGGKSAQEGWRADAGGFMGMRSAVLHPLGLPTNKRQTEGKPFMCTEILWPRPHPFEVEGPLLVAAYQQLAGADGMAWAGPRDITWERRDAVYYTFWRVEGSMPMRPFSCAGPSTLGQFPAAAAMLRLGLLKPGPVVVRETRTEEEIIAGAPPVIAEEFAYDPTQFARGAAQDTLVAGGVPKEAFLIGRVTVRLADAPAPAQVMDMRPFIGGGIVTSATKELVMDTRRGLFTINAPAAQGAVGFLRDAGVIRLLNVRIRSSALHGTVAVVALDAKPLDVSRRILVQTGTRAVPTGWRESVASWEEGGRTNQGLRIDATGDLPWRVRNETVTVTLPRAAVTKATVLDGNGMAVPSITGVLARTRNSVRINVPPGVMYVVLE